ncbi:MAG TPA: CotH kinase family protein [Polyangiaceae bacterium]
MCASRRGWGSVLTSVGLILGCNGGDGREPAGAGGSPSGGGSTGAPPVTAADCAQMDPTLAEADASELFEGNTVPTFDILMPAAQWQELQRQARDEEYVEATACFEGRGLGRIAVRFKGAYGSLIGCFDEHGNNTCKKLPMKLKFSEFEEDKRFFGLKRLNFHSNRYDQTYLRERLSYDLFRSMGVVAPRAAWALVRVNGETYGLFGMVEQVDGRFTEDRWPELGNENLYKEAWPVFTDVDWVTSRLETNEEQPDVSAFIAFSQAMLDADDAELRDTLGQYVDLDYWARYQAVDDAIAAYDGITAYYTNPEGSWSANHNFYLYQEAPQHFTLIPWDVESTFTTNSGFGWVPHWTQTPDDCSKIYPVWSGGGWVHAPGCDRVFRALAADLTAYRRAGQEFLDGPFSEDAMLSAIETHAARLRDVVAKAPNGPTLGGWESGLAFLRSEIPNLRDRFTQLLAGEFSAPAEIQTDGVTDFEALDDQALLNGPWLGCNANSTVEVSINTSSPMEGKRDLLMAFEYADEEEPWEHWASYRVPVAQGSFDARERQGIRLWLRADEPRTLRFDLDSPTSNRVVAGIRLGWDVPVSQEPALVELLFEDAALPFWAPPGDENLQEILRTLSGLVFFPNVVGRDTSTGQLGDGITDPGFVHIDAIEFF